MNFIGFQSPLDNLSLANLLGGELSLYVANTDLKLPCLFNSIAITNEHSIPQEPVDSNQYVSDNIVTKPTIVSLSLFVYEHNMNEFFRLVDMGMASDGFLFVNRNKRRHQNLYVTNLTQTYSGEKLGGFDCEMELQEVMKVHAMGSMRTKVSIPVVDQGTTVASQVAPQELDNRTMLKTIVNKLGFLK